MSFFIVLWIRNWNLIFEWEEKSGRGIGIFTMLESESYDDNFFCRFSQCAEFLLHLLNT